MFKLLSSWILAQCLSEREHSKTTHDVNNKSDKHLESFPGLGGGVLFSRLNKWMALEAKE